MTINDVVSSRVGRDDIAVRVHSHAALSDALIAEVEQACVRAEDSAGGYVVLQIEHERGAPAQVWPGVVDIHRVNKWEQALRRLERSPAVVIATATGHCGGPALDLLLTADYRIASADLRLSPPVAAGQPWPGMALHRLANQVGVARARRLALFGADVTATQSVELGLVDETVATAADLGDAVDYAAALFSGFLGSELAIRRRLLLDAATTSFEESLGTHLAACDRTLRRLRRTS